MSQDAAGHMQQALDALGFQGDPEMSATASRFVAMLGERLPAARPMLSVCASPMPGQLVAVRGIPFYSLCAHHLLPFFGTVGIAYRSGERLAGLGALPRAVQWAARRPQLQERVAADLADLLQTQLEAEGLLVRVVARHMCVEMRGAERPAEVIVETARGDAAGLRELLVG